MITTHTAGDVTVFADAQEVPGLGHVPVNAYLLHAEQPVVIDTGLSLADRDYLAALSAVIDPASVRWIWLTHPDRDHTGGLKALLAAAPQARLITTFVGVGILSLSDPPPLDRAYFLNPGQSLNVGDRELLAFRPPVYDNPATVGLFDRGTGSCFSSDCFGAPLPSPEAATSPDVGGLPAQELRDRQLLWLSVDSPWVQHATSPSYLDTVRFMQSLHPSSIFSSHLPASPGASDAFFDMLASAPGLNPFVGPDQAALEHLLKSFEPAPV
jgi:hypothetical protein